MRWLCGARHGVARQGTRGEASHGSATASWGRARTGRAGAWHGGARNSGQGQASRGRSRQVEARPGLEGTRCGAMTRLGESGRVWARRGKARNIRLYQRKERECHSTDKHPVYLAARAATLRTFKRSLPTVRNRTRPQWSHHWALDHYPPAEQTTADDLTASMWYLATSLQRSNAAM